MELADWGERWDQGQIGFHQTQVSELLEKYADRAWGTETLDRVLVPLCGKSLDMVFLAGRAEAVVGVEYVEQAVTEFFAEQHVVPEVQAGSPPKYSAGKYTLFAADFFEITGDHIGVVDAVFDRACLVALESDVRAEYANHVRSLLHAGTRTLLITFDYDQTAMSGPPFAVSVDEVHRLFEDGFVIEHLETRDALNPTFRERGLAAMTESAFVLTRR